MKKQNISFFEKILTQTQGRKLTTMGIFKFKRNMQKQCPYGCFTCFRSMFDKRQTYPSHINDDNVYYNVL